MTSESLKVAEIKCNKKKNTEWSIKAQSKVANLIFKIIKVLQVWFDWMWCTCKLSVILKSIELFKLIE